MALSAQGMVAAAFVAACGHPEAPRVVAGHEPAGSAVEVAVPIDAPEPTQEEKLAAIQKAINELDEAAQACWASAAVDRLDIEGELSAMIAIAAGAAEVDIVRDTVHAPKLAACLRKLLAAYPWAPPLRGQTIQIPFKFRAPDWQNTIDRTLVPWNGQGKVSVAVLLDQNNTGNEAASMFELAVESGGSTGLRISERAELWYFMGNATVRSANGTQAIAGGDMMFVPRGGVRDVAAAGADVHAVIVAVPGEREGTARGGALPTREATGTWDVAPTPVVLRASAAKSFGPATIFAEPASIKEKTLAASLLVVPAGTTVPVHSHNRETEMLYVLAGAGTLTVDGVALAVTPTSVIQIPPTAKHGFTATADVRALQIYTPSGPEQRFKINAKSKP